MWDERYSAVGFAYGTEPNDFLVEQAEQLKAPVLCLAEGEGRNAVFIASKGLAVLGVDQSAVGLAKAQRLAQSRGVTIQTEVADLTRYDLGKERYGSIVSIWAHLPPAERAQLHQRCVVALRPGGTFILEAYTPDQIPLGTGGPQVPALCMTRDLLAAELAGLELVIAREVRREVLEGPFHTGPSATVQILARKPG